VPHANRVTPFGDFEATAARGMLTGNRGVLHDVQGVIGQARWRHPHWIACALAYKGWKRKLLQPGRWTELFFLDEATACAAGHRPCALCRRADYERLRDAWERAHGVRQTAAAMDRALHAARILPGSRRLRTWAASLDAAAEGTMVALPQAPETAWLLLGGRLRRWTHFGYGEESAAPEGEVTILTPAPLVACFAAGYRPALHASALSPPPASSPGGSPAAPRR